jgi:ATP-dependent Clp protease ATP-binding subunit ClpC
MFERFTDQARLVVVQAQEATRRLGYDYVGTEHILLGVISQGEGVASQVLTGLGANPDRVREQVVRLLDEYQTRQREEGPAHPNTAP